MVFVFISTGLRFVPSSRTRIESCLNFLTDPCYLSAFTNASATIMCFASIVEKTSISCKTIFQPLTHSASVKHNLHYMSWTFYELDLHRTPHHHGTEALQSHVDNQISTSLHPIAALPNLTWLIYQILHRLSQTYRRP